MITTRVKIQLIAFSILTAIAVGLIAFHYVNLPVLMGFGQVQASADFPQGAGIYPDANVTYRGVTVGKVTAVGLSPHGVKVSFRVASSAHVPSDVRASIKSVSAIGEQYVDLVPRHVGGVMLTDGDVIPRTDTTTPVQTAAVLDDTSKLLESVPLRNLNTVLTEADKAFSNLGPKLDSLTTSTMDLVQAADANYQQTHALLGEGSHFLNGQLASSASMRSWSQDLASFSTTLHHGDAHLRSMLKSIPGAAWQGKATLDMLTKDLQPLLVSGKVLADLTADYIHPIEQVLNVYPLVMMKNIAFVTADPTAGRLGFKSVVGYPGSCSTGWPRSYQKLGPRGPNALKDEALPNVYCKIPQKDNRLVRGARNLQCFEPGAPPGRRAATIYQCRGNGYGATGGNPPPTKFISVPGADAINGILSKMGASHRASRANASGSTKVKREHSWQALMLEPLAR